MVLYASAPDGDEAIAEAQRMVREVTSALKIQEIVTNWLSRRRAWAEERVAAAEEEAQRAAEYAADGAARGWERPPPEKPAEPEEEPPEEEPPEPEKAVEDPPAAELSPDEDEAEPAFTIRNLDTGEAMAVQLEASSEGELSPTLRSKLSFGALQPGSAAWEATKGDCRGLLEKLASKSTFSFRSYQLCVWQERYVYAEDDALCYQQLSQDRVPHGACKRILYSSIQFVGALDETQFVLQCARRSYTFLCESNEARTRWIKTISQLAGCSASTEICRHTTRKNIHTRAKR